MPELKNINVPQIAMVCHEANRRYCRSIGDDSQAAWEDAQEWQRRSAIDGVVFHLDSLTKGVTPPPSASHESWLAAKEADGWKYGPTKNPDTKEHPCFVPYNELPFDQRVKDYIFGGIVSSFYEASVS